MRINFNKICYYPRLPWIAKIICVQLLLSLQIAQAKINIFACEPEYAELARIIDPTANIYTATTAFQDPHQVQARPSLIAKIRRANLVICAGADLEVGWLPMLQMKSANPNIQNGKLGLFFASDHVQTLDKNTNADRSGGDIHAKGNPHVHFDPKMVLMLANKLTIRMEQLNPKQKSYYQQNLFQFTQRWQVFIKLLSEKAKPLNGLNLIAYHSNFRYLFNWLGINQVADLEPKPGLPPTSRHLVSLINIVKQKKVQGIVIASYQDPRGANWLANRTGLPIITLPMTINGNANSDDLFALYEDVVNQLLTGIAKNNDN